MSERQTPESTRRNSVQCRSIRLADGNEWSFLSPSARFVPRVVVETDAVGRRVESIALDIKFGYPLHIEALIAELKKACEQGSVMEQYEAFFALAVSLILQVHDIRLQTVCELLAVGREELAVLVNDVLSVISDPENLPAANDPETSRREPT